MKRSSSLIVPLATAATFFAATPAYAQTYEDTVGAGVGFGFFTCWGLVVLVSLALLVLNVWMLIDAIGRQEYEYPNSNGNSKNLWIILLIVGIVFSFGWIVALVYYFSVYKKVRRGSVAPPWAAGQQMAPGMAPQSAPPAYQPPPAPPAAPSPTAPPPAPPASPAPPAPPAAPMPAPPAPPAAPAAPAPAPEAPPAPPSEPEV